MTATLHRCWVYGDDVNTDVIFPGKYTYTLTDPAELAAHALEDLDPPSRARSGRRRIVPAQLGARAAAASQAVSALKARRAGHFRGVVQRIYSATAQPRGCCRALPALRDTSTGRPHPTTARGAEIARGGGTFRHPPPLPRRCGGPDAAG